MGTIEMESNERVPVAAAVVFGIWLYIMGQVYAIYLDILHFHSTVLSLTTGVTTLETDTS
jgi:hypothetical protein